MYDKTHYDDCGYTAFDYECQRAYERIVETRDISFEDEEVLDALADYHPEIREIIEEGCQ